MMVGICYLWTLMMATALANTKAALLDRNNQIACLRKNTGIIPLLRHNTLFGIFIWIVSKAILNTWIVAMKYKNRLVWPGGCGP